MSITLADIAEFLPILGNYSAMRFVSIGDQRETQNQESGAGPFVDSADVSELTARERDIELSKAQLSLGEAGRCRLLGVILTSPAISFCHPIRRA